jgi:hypothetical protein
MAGRRKLYLFAPSVHEIIEIYMALVIDICYNISPLRADAAVSAQAHPLCTYQNIRGCGILRGSKHYRVDEFCLVHAKFHQAIMRCKILGRRLPRLLAAP